MFQCYWRNIVHNFERTSPECSHIYAKYCKLKLNEIYMLKLNIYPSHLNVFQNVFQGQ